MPKSPEPHPVDIFVGQRVALRRKLLRMSQKDLAEHVGYSYQQVQKYEKGFNRVSASVLYEFSKALDVPVSFFFDGMPQTFSNGGPHDDVPQPGNYDHDPLRKPDVLKVVRDYDRIANQRARKKLQELVRACAESLSAPR